MSRVHELSKLNRTNLLAKAQAFVESNHGGDRSLYAKLTGMSQDQLVSFIVSEEEKAG